MDEAEVRRRFTSYPVGETQAAQMAGIRESARLTAEKIAIETPACREQSLAITALEEAVFWANAAIARPSEVRGRTGG